MKWYLHRAFRSNHKHQPCTRHTVSKSQGYNSECHKQSSWLHGTYLSLPGNISVMNCISITITCAACYLHGVGNLGSPPTMWHQWKSQVDVFPVFLLMPLLEISWLGDVFLRDRIVVTTEKEFCLLYLMAKFGTFFPLHILFSSHL